MVDLEYFKMNIQKNTGGLGPMYECLYDLSDAVSLASLG